MKILYNVIATLLACGLGFYGILQLKEASEAQKMEDTGKVEAQKVRTTLVQEEEIQERESFYGFLQPLEEIKLAPEVSAKIIKRYKKEGERIQAGETIFELDSKSFVNQVKISNATIQGLESQLKFAKNELQRTTVLVKQESLQETELERLQSEVDRLQALLLSQQAILEEAQRNVERCKVVAQRNAILYMDLQEVGEFAAVGNPLCILRVQDPLELKIEVPALWRLALKPGMEFQGSIEDVDSAFHSQKKNFKAKIARLPQGASRESRRFPIVFEIDNQDRELFAGLYASIELVLPSLKKVITVPKEAVIKKYGQTWVHKIVPAETQGEGKVNDVEVQVQPLTRRPAHWRILSGLNAQDRIVIYPLDKVSSGMSVRFQVDPPANEKTETREN